jgi:hypothetical protein
MFELKKIEGQEGEKMKSDKSPKSMDIVNCLLYKIKNNPVKTYRRPKDIPLSTS